MTKLDPGLIDEVGYHARQIPNHAVRDEFLAEIAKQLRDQLRERPIIDYESLRLLIKAAWRKVVGEGGEI